MPPQRTPPRPRPGRRKRLYDGRDPPGLPGLTPTGLIPLASAALALGLGATALEVEAAAGRLPVVRFRGRRFVVGADLLKLVAGR